VLGPPLVNFQKSSRAALTTHAAGLYPLKQLKEGLQTMQTIFASRFLHRSLSTAMLLAVSGAGCTDDPGMMETDEVIPDTTAPLVVSSTPGTNATGIAADAKVMVTFSEPMDPASVEAAYGSAQLPLDKVSFVWNSELTELTISPDAPLAYADGVGTDPAAVSPLTYAITIGTGAADLAGNQLAAPMELSFATKRRLVGTFSTDPALTKGLLDASVLAGVSLFIGDSATGKRYHSYVTFDIAPLPAGSMVEGAQFGGTQTAPYGVPYTLGGVVAQHLTYSTMDNVGAVQALSVPGLLSSNGMAEAKALDVTAQLKDDVMNRAARGDRSQFRLQIDTATNDDAVADTAVFTKNTFKLHVTYVAD